MKNILFTYFFLLFLFLYFNFSVKCQSAFEDAIVVKKIIDVDSNKKFILDISTRPLVVRYFGNYEDAELKSMFLLNPFLKDIFVTGGSASIKRAGLNADDFRTKTMASIGSFDVTNLAIGLTDFLIERAKGELNTAFFKRLQEELDDNTKYPELKTLFPSTCRVLNVIGNEIYQFDLYLNSLRNAFDNDLRSLLQNFKKVLENKRSDKNSSLYLSLMLSLDFADWVENNRHPGEILNLIANSQNTRKLSKENDNCLNYTSALRTLALFSESFRSTSDSGNYWVKRQDLDALKNDTTLRIYLGLVYQQSKKDSVFYKFNKNANESIYLYELLGKIEKIEGNPKTEYNSIREFVYQLIQIGQDVELQLENLKAVRNLSISNPNITQRQRNKLLFDASYDVFNSMTKLLKQVNNLNSFTFLADYTFNTETANKFIQHFEDAGEIALHITNRQYSGAIAKTTYLLSNFIKTDDFKITITKFLKYGTFMAAMVDSESPEQAKSAIEAIALPAGSYSIKRHSTFNISLNGYLGVFVGHEFLGNGDLRIVNNLSLSAPIGLYLGWGQCNTTKNPWSFGFFIPIIDLGTVASYRLRDDKIESIPTIKFHHLIAPGIFVEFGIPCTPLSLSIGTQIGPNLRKFDESINDVPDYYWRLGAALKVDIPLLNFIATPP